jgi:hypothetical protein
VKTHQAARGVIRRTVSARAVNQQVLSTAYKRFFLKADSRTNNPLHVKSELR